MNVFSNKTIIPKGYELTNFCEFDKYASTSYCAIHGVDENLNLGDITKVDETQITPFTMICGGSPCQDFSVAGKQSGSKWKCKDCNHEYNPLTIHFSERHKCPKCGNENLDKTRSSLLVEWLRVIRYNKPQWGIYENVKNIVGTKFKETFKMFLNELHEYGYNTYFKVLNAKDFGVPQNRERVFLIIILKELDNGKFKSPRGFDNGVRLKDILEDNVDDKYYLSEKVQNRLKIIDETFTKNIVGTTKVATGYKQPKQILIDNTHSLQQVGQIYGTENEPNPQAGRVYNSKGISPTLDSCSGGNRMPKIVIHDKEYINNINNNNFYVKKKAEEIFNKKGYLPEMFNPYNKSEIVNVAPTQTTTCGSTTGSATVCIKQPNYLIRRLTPKECWRLMGFFDEDFKKAQIALNNKFYKGKNRSDSQLYKQAGNSIVVNVLYYIYKELYKAMPYLFDDLKVSSYFSGIGAFEKALDRLFFDINKNY